MSATKDNKTGKWISRFYYTTYEGNKKQAFKRGFATKKEALEYEREFLNKLDLNIDMTFKSLYELYMEDVNNRLRKHTLETKKNIIESKILPFFKKLKISEITPVVVRRWQNIILNAEKNGQKYSQTYIKTINNQLVAIFNYAVKFHNLKENPCHKAGSIGKKNAHEMTIWTVEEFDKFYKAIHNKPMISTGFYLLFWTGIRIGELLALTVGDIDFDKKTLRINKSYQRINGEDVITAPKTPKSIRTIDLSDDCIMLLADYLNKLYSPEEDTRLFNSTKHAFEKNIALYSKKANVKKIRVHDLRHSHASFLINNNVNILAIASRLGHEKIETTLNIYSHLYRSSYDYMIDVLNKK